MLLYKKNYIVCVHLFSGSFLVRDRRLFLFITEKVAVKITDVMQQ